MVLWGCCCKRLATVARRRLQLKWLQRQRAVQHWTRAKLKPAMDVDAVVDGVVDGVADAGMPTQAGWQRWQTLLQLQVPSPRTTSPGRWLSWTMRCTRCRRA